MSDGETIMRLQGKSALVTGAGGGLGGAIARRFAAEGASVLCSDRDLPKAEATVAAIAKAGGTASAFPADVAVAADCEAQVAETVSRYGRIDIAVNNAGIGVAGNIETCDFADWQRCFDINVNSIFHGCQKALPLMR